MPLGANKAALFGMGGVSVGDVVLLDTWTAGGEASKEYAGFSSDYKQLVWQFVNLHGSVADTDWTFQTKTGVGSYGISTQSSAWRAYNSQNGSLSAAAYWPGADANQSTSLIMMSQDLNFTDAELALSGSMTLNNPTSSVYYKNWISRGAGNLQTSSPPAMGAFIAGYILTGVALDSIQFEFDSPTANIDTGKILYWGIK